MFPQPLLSLWITMGPLTLATDAVVTRAKYAGKFGATAQAQIRESLRRIKGGRRQSRQALAALMLVTMMIDLFLWPIGFPLAIRGYYRSLKMRRADLEAEARAKAIEG